MKIVLFLIVFAICGINGKKGTSYCDVGGPGQCMSKMECVEKGGVKTDGCSGWGVTCCVSKEVAASSSGAGGVAGGRDKRAPPPPPPTPLTPVAGYDKRVQPTPVAPRKRRLVPPQQPAEGTPRERSAPAKRQPPPRSFRANLYTQNVEPAPQAPNPGSVVNSQNLETAPQMGFENPSPQVSSGHPAVNPQLMVGIPDVPPRIPQGPPPSMDQGPPPDFQPPMPPGFTFEQVCKWWSGFEYLSHSPSAPTSCTWAAASTWI